MITPDCLPSALPVRTAAAALVLSLALLVSGCTAVPDDEPTTAPSEPEVSESQAPETGDPDAPAEAETPADSDMLPELGRATATVDDGTVDVIVRSLDVDANGTTMTLRVAFVPHLETDAERPRTLSGINDAWFVLPVLLDRQYLKRYSVITGEGAQDWLTNTDAETTDGVPLESWFVYAAPEDPIDTIAFTIDAWSVEIPDIPVGGGQ